MEMSVEIEAGDLGVGSEYPMQALSMALRAFLDV
jgi:hypothetical protein